MPINPQTGVFTPAANEYSLASAVTAGFPTVTATYVRCVINNLCPGVSAELSGQLLDTNGNVIVGGKFVNTYDISGLTSFNSTLHTLIQEAASGYGVTVN